MVRGGSAARREASDRPPCAVEVAAGDADDDGAVLAADARPGSLARRQTVGRTQSRKWGEVSSAQWQRWPGGPSRGRGAPVAQARRDMSGDRGENAMCDQLSLSS